MRVSHKTIYECLYLQAGCELRTEGEAGAAPRPYPGSQPVAHVRDQGKGQWHVNISERPKRG
jgi:hypothetical protein